MRSAFLFKWLWRRAAAALASCLLGFAATLVMVACASTVLAPSEEDEMAMQLSSAAFQDGAGLPAKYTCDGQNVSPPLAWSGAPSGTQSLALILEDPDAPLRVFTHWVLFNLPADATQLPEGVPQGDRLPNGALQGKNDVGRNGYGGPCPPPGPAHRYHFTIYALDRSLSLAAGASKGQALDAMQGHVLARGDLTGTYGR